MHRTLYALFHHFAGHFVRIVDIAVEIVIVRATPARTDKFRETVFAFFTGEKTGVFELLADIFSRYSLLYVAHFKILVSRKLMTGI